MTADPQVVFHAPGWDDELLAAVGRELSIENSVAVSGDTVYFANSGGLVQGWDIAGLRDDPAAVPERVFRFWTGDDTDASLVIDAEGMIYAGVEYQRGTDRSHEVGQIIKLDPSRPDDPLVWSVHVRGALNASGVWATPGLHRDLLIVPTHTGHVYGVDTATGEVRWTKKLPGPTWPSPAIVDDVWIQGDCGGGLYAFDVSDTTVEPPELWSISLGRLHRVHPSGVGRPDRGRHQGRLHPRHPLAGPSAAGSPQGVPDSLGGGGHVYVVYAQVGHGVVDGVEDGRAGADGAGTRRFPWRLAGSGAWASPWGSARSWAGLALKSPGSRRGWWPSGCRRRRRPPPRAGPGLPPWAMPPWTWPSAMRGVDERSGVVTGDHPPEDRLTGG